MFKESRLRGRRGYDRAFVCCSLLCSYCVRVGTEKAQEAHLQIPNSHSCHYSTIFSMIYSKWGLGSYEVISKKLLRKEVENCPRVLQQQYPLL